MAFHRPQTTGSQYSSAMQQYAGQRLFSACPVIINSVAPFYADWKAVTSFSGSYEATCERYKAFINNYRAHKGTNILGKIVEAAETALQNLVQLKTSFDQDWKTITTMCPSYSLERQAATYSAFLQKYHLLKDNESFKETLMLAQVNENIVRHRISQYAEYNSQLAARRFSFDKDWKKTIAITSKESLVLVAQKYQEFVQKYGDLKDTDGFSPFLKLADSTLKALEITIPKAKAEAQYLASLAEAQHLASLAETQYLASLEFRR